MTSTYAFRVLIIAGFALTLVTATSPVVVASDGTGSQGSHSTPDSGKFLDARTQVLAQSRLSKDGGPSNAVVVAITAYETARNRAIVVFQTVSLSAREAYQMAISPAALLRKTSLESANTALLISLTSTTTDNGKATADDTFKTAVRAANDALKMTNESARMIFKASIKSAEQALKVSLEAADSSLRQAISAARTSHPTRTSSPGFRPSPSAN